MAQDLHSAKFMKDGLYTEWRPERDGHRIDRLHDNDLDKKAIVKDKTDGKITNEIYLLKTDKLLTERRAQLSKFIGHIAGLCFHSEQDDIVQNSTSMRWIQEYLQTHYDIESRGVHFLKLSKIHPKPGQSPQTFYKQFRAAFADNLRKRGDQVEHLGVGLTEDEN